MNFPVFDLHCDTALGLLGKDLISAVNLKQNNLHIDLDRAAALPGYAQCFACFTTPMMREWFGASPEMIFQRELDAILSQLAAHSGQILQAYSAAEVRRNQAEGKMSAILTIEGPAGFGYDPDLLEDLFKVGFRITSLGWNEHGPLCGSNLTGGGLTDLGRAYFREAQRLGMVVDVSHCSDEAFWDMMELTEAPLIATHSNSRSICAHSRNLTDDMFLAICQSGGVAGLNLCVDFLGEGAGLDTACDHIFHFMELDPDGTHLALGGDLDGCETLPTGFEGVQSYPSLGEKLLERGLTEENVRNLYWNNALGVMEKCCI